MPHRRRISVKLSASGEEEIKSFILAKKAKGYADKTLATYQQHFSAISEHLDLGQGIEKLKTNSLEQMVVSMRDAELAPNSIKSYSLPAQQQFHHRKRNVTVHILRWRG